MGWTPDVMHVTVPASSANLGPGFDCLGLALDLPFELATREALDRQSGRYLDLEPGHPAHGAFLEAGGDRRTLLGWRSPIPPGRGLGFSGAARVAGAYLGSLGRGMGDEESVDRAYAIAASLEGHGDNAAASAYGGLCVSGASGAIKVPVSEDLFDTLSVIVWSPDAGTSTKAARMNMETTVPMAAAVASIAGTATWVAAMTAGRTELLRGACDDHLHQPGRLHARPDSRRVLDQFLEIDSVLAAWLSGSGPSVAALLEADDARTVTADLTAWLVQPGDEPAGALPSGRLRTLSVSSRGAHRIFGGGTA